MVLCSTEQGNVRIVSLCDLVDRRQDVSVGNGLGLVSCLRPGRQDVSVGNGLVLVSCVRPVREGLSVGLRLGLV